jgi:hypothetical protein
MGSGEALVYAVRQACVAGAGAFTGVLQHRQPAQSLRMRLTHVWVLCALLKGAATTTVDATWQSSESGSYAEGASTAGSAAGTAIFVRADNGKGWLPNNGLLHMSCSGRHRLRTPCALSWPAFCQGGCE